MMAVRQSLEARARTGRRGPILSPCSGSVLVHGVDPEFTYCPLPRVGASSAPIWTMRTGRVRLRWESSQSPSVQNAEAQAPAVAYGMQPIAGGVSRGVEKRPRSEVTAEVQSVKRTAHYFSRTRALAPSAAHAQAWPYRRRSRRLGRRIASRAPR